MIQSIRSSLAFPSLGGRVAAITGGSRGLGLAMALALVENEVSVIIGSPSNEANHAALKKIEVFEGQAVCQFLDVTKRESCEAFVQSAIEHFGQLDIMLCNAGVSISETAFETSQQTWAKTIGVDLDGVFNSSVAAARKMTTQPSGGSIVVTSSNASLVGFNGLSAYGAAKGGVNQLVRSLALEWGQHNIRVNAVAPGWTDHRMEGNDHSVNTAAAEAAIARTPLKRFGTAEEIVAAALFLASDCASFITGTVLVVDGGYTSG
ncbi:oxidoreductase [Mesorhizobium hawassense]|uniref:Oxidoreductase n=1 Tax=Mesorhizobium hawassense TaxID=1209954 RepID=A0A330HU63_9HYPH|nr:SDR family NAD(P)-dependent oxidoreductase [Mesorhizobium hawassense]RAZ91743.1 oxidoreductase [Mesorhizobium hawassense]